MGSGCISCTEIERIKKRGDGGEDSDIDTGEEEEVIEEDLASTDFVSQRPKIRRV